MGVFGSKRIRKLVICSSILLLLMTGSYFWGLSDNELRNPSSKELEDFLKEDKTSDRIYIKGEYECTEFSSDIKKNANAHNIRCAVVLLECEDFASKSVVGHSMTYFETTDKGFTYVESTQGDDYGVVLQIGDVLEFDGKGGTIRARIIKMVKIW